MNSNEETITFMIIKYKCFAILWLRHLSWRQ